MRATQNTRSNAWWLDQLGRDAPDPKVVAELATYLRGNLVRIMRSRGGFDEADVDDFTQDALLHILKGLDSFRGDSRFTTWATAIATRVAFSALRRRRFQDVSLDELTSGSEDSGDAGTVDLADPARELGKKSLLEELRRAIDTLTERQRLAVLGELAGIPTPELAVRLGTNRNALYKLHHDARKRLKEALSEAGYSGTDVRHELSEATHRS